MKAKFSVQNTTQNGQTVRQTPEFIVVAGPTASGKSDIAMALAERYQGTIVCCDSVQLYRGFDIGSAKPSLADRERVPHHLYDVFNWDEACDAAAYAQLARRAINEIRGNGRVPILVGGTGLYLRALLGDAWDSDVPSDEGLRRDLSQRPSGELFSDLQKVDPARASQLHPNDRFRVIRALEINKLTGQPVKFRQANTVQFEAAFMILVCPDRPVLHERIQTRTSEMLRGGLEREVRELLNSGVDPHCKPMQSIGYKQLVAMIQDKLDSSQLEEKISAATRQYAKRQMTWFKKVPADIAITGSGDLSKITGLVDGIFKK
jgi:tRNA dimethylallyltransferase